MSGLQKKAIKKIIWGYLAAVCIGGIFSYYAFFQPLRDKEISRLSQQHSFIAQETDAQMYLVREYANYLGYSQQLQQLYAGFQADVTDEAARYNLGSMLNQMKNLKLGVRSIAIQGRETPLVFSIIEPKEEELKLFESDWYQRLTEQAYGSKFSAGLQVYDSNTGNGKEVIAFAKNFNTRNLHFTITIFLDFHEIFGGINRYQAKEFADYLWLDYRGEPLFADSRASRLYADLTAMQEGAGSTYAITDGVLFMEQLTQGSYTLAAYKPNALISSEFIGLLSTILVVLTAFLLLSLFLVYRMVRQEEEKQVMRFGLIISQIDPHFVCNTLNTIYYLAKLKRNEDVAVISTALSNILRDRLRIKDFQIYDTVAQEIDTVKQYLKIQEYRYGSGVLVTFDIQPEADTAMIPKNIVQPLVENCLLHGLADVETGVISGSIAIRAGIDGKRLKLTVEDDGCGMEPWKLAVVINRDSAKSRQNRDHGIGIAGVMNRLQILYKKDFRFDIESSPGKGTKIIIECDCNGRIPYYEDKKC